MKRINLSAYLAVVIFLIGISFPNNCEASELTNLGLHVIPYPQQVEIGGNDFILKSPVNIMLDKNSTGVDRQSAELLKKRLQEEWGVKGVVGTDPGSSTIILTRKGAPKSIGDQGYSLATDTNVLTIRAKREDGLFYGVQTIFQLLKKTRGEVLIPGMEITDWPDINIRAVHYDTKHHQDKSSYVKSFIRDLARYKINMLVWEWEDKLAYKSH
ncbi:MAG: beta-N-acetylhexosaminidase, partial [Cyclobacteriaceae bacterium]|nr:beta-N-acetylhexosaminidase [Cyclobacteriaceae bacterium]